MDDIRIKTGFKGHEKREYLASLLQIEKGPTDYLVDLWITIRERRPNGDITDWTVRDIAIRAGWTKDPKAFVQALVNSGWLDTIPSGGYKPHDWEEHQEWAMGELDRKIAGTVKSYRRWSNPNCTGQFSEKCFASCSKTDRSLCKFYQGTSYKEEKPKAAMIVDESRPKDPIMQELLRLSGWGLSKLKEDAKWINEFLEDYPSITPEDIRHCRDFHSNKKKHDKGMWKTRLRNWMKNKRVVPGQQEEPRQYI